MRPRITFLIGCTACGKGAVGRALAQRIGAEILSVDSMKVYRRMDIGTAKPSPAVRAAIPHHLIDVAEPSSDFSVAQFVALADRAIRDITSRSRPVLAVGGTALYIKAMSGGLFEGPSADPQIRERLKQQADAKGSAALHTRLAAIDPPAAERIHPNDLRRIVRALEVHEITGQPITRLQTQWDAGESPYDCTFIGLRRDREDQSRRTNLRVHRMIDAGWVAEVEALLKEDPPLSGTARQALGYAEIIRHLAGQMSLDEAVETIKINTRHFTKSQRTWFKRFANVHWIDLTPDADAETIAEQIAGMGIIPCFTRPK